MLAFMQNNMIINVQELDQKKYFKESLYSIEVDNLKRIEFLRIISDLKGVTFFQGFKYEKFTTVYKFVIRWRTMVELKEKARYKNN